LSSRQTSQGGNRIDRRRSPRRLGEYLKPLSFNGARLRARDFSLRRRPLIVRGRALVAIRKTSSERASRLFGDGEEMANSAGPDPSEVPHPPPPSLLPLIFQCHRESSRTKERGLITRTRRMAADPHVGHSSSSIFPLDVQIIRSRSPDQDQREERAKERRRCRDLRDRRGAAGASYGPEIGLEAAATLSLLAPSPSLLLPPSRFTLSRSLSTPCGGTLAAIFQRCMPVYTLHQARESYERGECRSRYRSTAEQQRLPERKRERERERERTREGGERRVGDDARLPAITRRTKCCRAAIVARPADAASHDSRRFKRTRAAPAVDERAESP